MVSRTISGQVLVGTASVGSVSGNYTDLYNDDVQDNIVNRVVGGQVLVGTASVGSVSGNYTDIVTLDGGGQTNSTIGGQVLVGTASVGSVSGNYLDVYGATQAQEPVFVIVSISAPSSVAPGQAVQVQVTVRNDGVDGTANVQIQDSNNTVVDQVSVPIQANTEQQVQLQFQAPNTEGQYTYTVVVIDTSTNQVDDTGQFTINVQQAQPSFTIANVDYPSTVAPGQTITVTVTVRNDGGDGSATVQIRDNTDNVVAQQTVTIPGGSQQQVLLQFQAPSTAGQYTYSVWVVNNSTNLLDDSTVITVSVQSQQKTGGIDWKIIVAAALILILLAARRRG